jgi:hypothetical protein
MPSTRLSLGLTQLRTTTTGQKNQNTQNDGKTKTGRKRKKPCLGVPAKGKIPYFFFVLHHFSLSEILSPQT